ncbi:hypothetical protein AMATHDRAFT_78746 [Amanita thiersii Skay4041]|uniref:Glutathione synthetase n=1 Tax=Amanita thiersii Skay4041 TaxID=703135 RepID=A0A2A9NX11_9AGAR|nr:hypothetical protein AMATHDRAFT_78746 [Amanita thiersii Skay4041]
MSSFDYSLWPPNLSPTQLETLTLQATTYAFAHGLLYLPSIYPQPPAPNSAIHAPISLFPSPFPNKLFLQAKRFQRIYNVLYSRIAMDEEFLDQVMGAETGVGRVDDFIGQLWKGWKQLREQGLVQPLQLGIFRSDYMLHEPSERQHSLKQVEFNTISASFGALSERVSELHRYLFGLTHYFGVSPYLRSDKLPDNNTISTIADGLAEAHKAYGVPSSWILFVTQPNERNVFDQRWIEYNLFQRYQIRVIRQTFEQLAVSATVEGGTSRLCVSCFPDVVPTGFVEVSVVYYRSGYVPSEYTTPTHYLTRFLLERSRAIKCPSIALQLAGSKKIQEVLTQPTILERFLCDKQRGEVFGDQDIRSIRDTFMDMWGLDIGEDRLTPDSRAPAEGRETHGVHRAREKSLSLVLKPQREGGGNNVYKEAIPEFLDKLDPAECEAWIAMELITPPEGVGNYLLRPGSTGNEAKTAVKADVISELGIFGWSLFGRDGKVSNEAEGGWLLRTKGKESNEGGVATGFSVLDSLLLIDD